MPHSKEKEKNKKNPQTLRHLEKIYAQGTRTHGSSRKVCVAVVFAEKQGEKGIAAASSGQEPSRASESSAWTGAVWRASGRRCLKELSTSLPARERASQTVFPLGEVGPAMWVRTEKRCLEA